MERPSHFRFGPSRLAPAPLLVLLLMLGGCAGDSPSSANLTPSTGAQISLRSSAFAPGGPIPANLTCDGANESPSLSWTAPPTGTRSLALIVDDPDAPGGTFVHWVLYGIPAETRSLQPSLPAGNQLPDGSKQGTNSFGKTGYGGPCPPTGAPHHYRFHLYALDLSPDLPESVPAEKLRSAISGHVLAAGELVGTYARQH